MGGAAPAYGKGGYAAPYAGKGCGSAPYAQPPWERQQQAGWSKGGKGGGYDAGKGQGLNQGDNQLAGTLVQMFADRYPIDEDARNYLLNSSPNVVDRVVREFKPKIEGEADYSSLVMGFAKSIRNSAAGARRY